MDTKHGKILVVEDEAELREAIVALLRKLTPFVESAADGKEAFDRIRSGSFHAIISDIKMPRMDGMELMARVREFDQDIPFIIVTGHGDKGLLLEALHLGASDFIDKPFNKEHLFKVVGHAMALGLAVEEVKKETENLYQDQSVAKRLHLQKMKRAILLMKREAEIYHKK